ncbi:Sucrose nonfermenting 4 [Hibiscus syriacus]|uniref:Sucrose nonfermenting 4 n=1 Tax=Hibiscus syriacus TaxID=106335 RepID=A0A6A3BEJ5_HIBSY|nr:pectinesterase inhibitor-like [Hibiscus syriacus]KAE8714497.1 Sucrose nonfermenting 4 [Hibiscus syriacus]
MEEYAFCNNTFNQNLSPTADITALTQITVEQTLKVATDTHTLIVGLIEKATDPAEKNALTTCENAYHDVMNGFQQAASAFFEKDYNSMLKAEQPAPRAQASCTSIFNTPPNPPNPVAEQNTHTKILIAMAIVAGTQLTS